MNQNTSQNPPFLPTTTVVPENKDLFVPYFNRVYEDIANVVNDKDDSYYPMAISSTATNILNLPNFGAFVICVSAEAQASDGSWPPTITTSLCKSSANTAGSIAALGSQTGQANAAGGGTWSGITLTITSTSTNFQIAHSNTGVTGNFNIRVIGTQ